MCARVHASKQTPSLAREVCERRVADASKRLPPLAARAMAAAIRRSFSHQGVTACLPCAFPAVARLHSLGSGGSPDDRRSTRQQAEPATTRRLSGRQLQEAALAIRRRVASSPLGGVCIDGPSGRATWVAAGTTASVDHPLGTRHARLVGECFDSGVGQFRVEAVAPGEAPPHEFGVWAYDVDKWARASEELQKRCQFFGPEVLRRLLDIADERGGSRAPVPHRPPPVKHGRVIQSQREALRSQPIWGVMRRRIEVVVEPRPERPGWTRVKASGRAPFSTPFLVDSDDDRTQALEAIDAVLISGGYPVPIDRLCDGTVGMTFASAAKSRGARMAAAPPLATGVSRERAMWCEIRWCSHRLAADISTRNIEIAAGRLCRGRDSHAWHLADAIADAAVGVLQAGRQALQHFMQHIGFPTFNAGSWRCVVEGSGLHGATGDASGRFTSPKGARLQSFQEVAHFERRGGDRGVAPGRLTVGHIANGGGDCCPGMVDLRIDRSTWYGNFFPMLGREELRDPVCDAFVELASDPLSANVDAIAVRHGVTVDPRFSSASALTDLAVALDSLEMLVRSGRDRRLVCHCWPKRCHGDAILKIIDDRIRQGPMQARDDMTVCVACDTGDKNDGTRGGDARSSMNMDVSMGDDSTASGRATEGGCILGGAAGGGDGSMSMAAAAREGAAGGVQLSMSSSESRAAGAGSSGGGIGANEAAAMAIVTGGTQLSMSSSEPGAAGTSIGSGGVGASAAAAMPGGVDGGSADAGDDEPPKRKGKKRSMGAHQRADLARHLASG